MVLGNRCRETGVLIPFENRCWETGVLKSIAWKQMSFALRKLMSLGFTCPKLEGNYGTCTPPNSEIICVQNVGTKVVCGIIFFN
jgi:hypothetical protein